MLKLKRLASYFVFSFAFLFVSMVVNAQYSSITMQNLSMVKVDNLTDDQISRFWNQAQASGLTIEKLEGLAKQRRMSDEEFQKLKARIEKLEETRLKPEDAESTKTARDKVEGVDEKRVKEKGEKEEEEDLDMVFGTLMPKIFGAELFANKNLTFEPNLKMATPKDYQLGPDDEVIIDVYGNSEITHHLKVSPEGSIRIPLVGPVSVGGLTIEQAEKRILKQLSSIYSGINSGETAVAVTLGNIRSIKVTLVGEVNMPGSYTLPSLATVFNALYASGGPNENGSFRTIKVIRAGKVISDVDMYSFLINGQAKGNVRLQDQDVIKVNPYEARVEIAGEVKRPGFYEAKQGETLKDLISYAGGFTDEAYRDRIKVFRNTSKEKSVADVPADVMPMFSAQTGDKYVVDKVLERFANRVEIKGAVFRPGVFALEDGMTVSKLISKADGLKEDAFAERAIVYRLKEDNTAEMLSFNVRDVMSGKDDIPLKREDFVVIASKIEMREEYKVTINGEVLKPGVYTYGENMKVEDLIIAAGGLKESASNNVEIARRIKTIDPSSKSTEIATIIKYEINKENLQSTSNITLMPFDNVSIFPSPGYATQKNITIEGEVLFPGKYTISNKNERISDVIKRTGGLTAQAYPEGASLIRMTKLSGVDQVIKQLKLKAIEKQSSDTTKSKDLKTEEEVNTPSIVGIYLPNILKKPGSELDLLLEEGDIIRIPKMLQTVEVSGEVLYPVKVRYKKGSGFKSYVKGAGGFSARALKGRSYIVYANGTASSTSSFFFMHFYPKVKPGAEIVIPIKEDKRKLTAIEIASIATSTTTLALLLITLFK